MKPNIIFVIFIIIFWYSIATTIIATVSIIIIIKSIIRKISSWSISLSFKLHYDINVDRLMVDELIDFGFSWCDLCLDCSCLIPLHTSINFSCLTLPIKWRFCTYDSDAGLPEIQNTLLFQSVDSNEMAPCVT